MSAGTSRCLAILPTYDEVENLVWITDRILGAVPDLDLLIIDDNSPDGTGRLAEEIASRDPRVRVQHRTGKLGLGSAYLRGFAYGLDEDYDVLIEIDADGSHPPERLPEMIGTLRRDPALGLVIGSRWVPGGSVVNWPRWREALSRGGNVYSRVMLGIDVHDATAGFRAFRAEALRRVDLSSVASRGYFFQVELTLRILDSGFGIAEVPIEFREREHGESKMSGSIVLEAMLRVTGLGIRRRWRRLLRRGGDGRGGSTRVGRRSV